MKSDKDYVRVILRHPSFNSYIETIVYLCVRPIPGDYIQYSPNRNYKVVSVHMQSYYDGVVAVVESVSKEEYESVWGK